jgi:uncharacterized protein with von Willebrand factor type A (vWA) domain
MLVNFFHGLKDAGVPVTTRELLDLLQAMKHNLAFADIDACCRFWLLPWPPG